METRILYAMMAATAILVPGIAAAEGHPTYADKPAHRKPDAAHPTWKMQLLPGQAWIPAGGSATYSLVLMSRVDTTVKVSVAQVSDGASATLSAQSIEVAPQAASVVKLVLTAPANASRGPYAVIVTGVSGSGETHDARATLYVKEGPQEKAPWARKHDAEAKPIEHDERAEMGRVLDRVEKLEQRLSRIERLLCALAGDRAPAELCPRAEASTSTA